MSRRKGRWVSLYLGSEEDVESQKASWIAYYGGKKSHSLPTLCHVSYYLQHFVKSYNPLLRIIGGRNLPNDGVFISATGIGYEIISKKVVWAFEI
ncbi:hypothetical protein EPI10_004818 [Gossypium australe]|uniref:Uncharacterized protein n=1 Tax=Gossypium australe TaxID=47621 RepID=A0A5B6WNF6_9ROSI|nr:hypothetical protein EPI10_004818 [Gossypium australe]